MSIFNPAANALRSAPRFVPESAVDLQFKIQKPRIAIRKIKDEEKAILDFPLRVESNGPYMGKLHNESAWLGTIDPSTGTFTLGADGEPDVDFSRVGAIFRAAFGYKNDRPSQDDFAATHSDLDFSIDLESKSLTGNAWTRIEGCSIMATIEPGKFDAKGEQYAKLGTIRPV